MKKKNKKLTKKERKEIAREEYWKKCEELEEEYQKKSEEIEEEYRKKLKEINEENEL